MCQRRRSSSSSRPGCVNSKRENCLCGTGKGYAGASGSRDLLNHVDAAWQNSHDHHSSSYKTYDEDEAKQKLRTRIKQHLSFQTKKNEIRYSACPTFTYIRPQVSLYHCLATTVIDVILFLFFFLYSRFGLRFFRPLFSFFLSYLLLLKCSPP